MLQSVTTQMSLTWLPQTFIIITRTRIIQDCPNKRSLITTVTKIILRAC